MSRSWRSRAAVAIAVAVVPATATAAPDAPARYAAGAAPPSLRALVGALGANPSAAAQPRFAYLRKLDSHLQDLASGRSDDGALTATPGDSLVLSGGRVLVDVYVTGPLNDAARALGALGMDVAASSDRRPQRLIEGTVPASALPAVAGLAEARAVLGVEGFGTNVGSATSQGDAAHRGPQARALGPTGAGVTVGVISDSINRVGSGVAGSQASGDLPGPASTPPGQVTVLQDGSSGSSDEGRAMAEIIFDGAPGIRSMLFTTGQGAATRAAGIDNLVAQGARVIADDTFQITEPFFQDGIIAQAVDRARAAGVTYAVSAGNRARQSWEGTYLPMTDPRNISTSTENFDTAGGTDAVQTVGTFSNRTLFIELQWDEPFGQASTDLAVDVYQIISGTPNFAFTVDTDNVATTIPSEFVTISISGTATVGIAIRRKTGTRTPFMKYIVGNVPTFSIAEHATNSGAIDPDASSARGALTIAASNHATPATPEVFSSRGPTTKLFDKDGNRLGSPDVRAKPDLSGADGVATTVPNFGTFLGTSAAAPSVAAIAALVLSAKPALPVEGVAAILEDTTHTTDCTATAGVPDADCGFGFELADGAVQSALDSTPPVVTPTVTPATPDGANGWYTIAMPTVAWARSDAESPIWTTTGCDPGSVSTDTTTTLACSATSAGGTTARSVTLQRDSSPPTVPAIAGIAAQSYPAGGLPAASAITCTAQDGQSGLFGCAVTGYDATPGIHTLTATAANNAGLTSVANLTYSALAPRPAVSALRITRKRVRVRSILRSGVRLGLTAEAGAEVRATVTLRGRKVGRASRSVTATGPVSLRVRLSRTGRTALRKRRGTLKVNVTGSGANLQSVGLRGRVRTRR